MYRTPLSRPRGGTRTSISNALVALALAATSCAGGTDSTGCDGVTTEPLAPDSAIHVLANGTADYLSNPPTSGPHIAWSAPAVVNRPLTKAEQTGILETGDVLVQYRPDDIDITVVRDLATALPPRTHLAPNPDLPTAVVLTAHLTKQLCRALDQPAIENFAAEHTGPAVDQADGDQG